MNNIEKRATYAVGLYLYLLSYGKPISPTKLEEFWTKLFTENKINYKDKNENRYNLTLISEENLNLETFDYAIFLSYLEDLNQYLKSDWIGVALNLITNNCDVKITLSNYIEVKIIDSSNKELMNHSVNFVSKNSFSMTVGKKDLYIDGGFSKNIKFLNSLFGKTETSTKLYRDFKDIQKTSSYYDSVKYLYDYYVEEYHLKFDNPEYVSKLWDTLLYLTLDSVVDKTGDMLTKDKNKIHFNKETTTTLGLYFETTNDKTPILKVKCKYCDPEIFKIRTKKEKYKDNFRYKTYLEIGKGFELFTV